MSHHVMAMLPRHLPLGVVDYLERLLSHFFLKILVMAAPLTTSWIVPIFVAIITGIVSIIIGCISYLNSRRTNEENIKINTARENHENRLKALELDFAIQKSKHDARQEYEYNAIKRLYDELDPYMFQFLELSETARDRILILAKWSREKGKLEVILGFGINGAGMRKVVYDLFVPLAAFLIFRNKLTVLDISLVPIIRYQDVVSKIIFYLFDDDRVRKNTTKN
jgi:hypothetical protein